MFCFRCGASLRPSLLEGFMRWACPSCGWIHYNNPRPCVTALVESDGRLLLGKRAKAPGRGLWDLPGGFMEAGEDPETALIRELHEELGVGPVSLRLLGFYPDTYGEENIPILNIVYTCQIDGPIVPCRDEFLEVGWFEQETLPMTYAFASIAAMIRDWKRGLGPFSHDPLRE